VFIETDENSSNIFAVFENSKVRFSMDTVVQCVPCSEAVLGFAFWGQLGDHNFSWRIELY